MAEEEQGKDREYGEGRHYQWRSKDWGWHSANSWIWGVLFILAGAVLLLQQYSPELSIINAGNWWVIFILVPGVNMITRGWRVFRRTGQLWGPFLWGFMLVGFGLSQLLEGLGGEFIWPVILIVGGLGLLLGGRKG